VEVAVNAGEAEIALVVRTAMFERPDVIDMKGGQGRIVLMDLAILAAVVGTLPHESPRGGVHAALPDLNFIASRRRTATNLFART
jgi:hypothetical protein